MITRFRRPLFLFLITGLLSMSGALAQQQPVVQFETTLGSFEVTLDPQHAPVTVKHFLELVNAGHYNGTVFHRVIKGFMIQGGGLNEDLERVGGASPIRNEADNGLSNLTGTIAMARTMEPHSATDQFFINTVDNVKLDHTRKDLYGWGYTVFGKVSRGMDVVHKIENSPTASRGDRDDVPVSSITITRARQL
jgi:cyclophilin family peptidyl-prolyl cis-trans isomerase